MAPTAPTGSSPSSPAFRWLSWPSPKFTKIAFGIFFVIGVECEVLSIVLGPDLNSPTAIFFEWNKAAANYLWKINNQFPGSPLQFMLWPFELGFAITWLALSVLLWPLWVGLKAFLFGFVGSLWMAILWNIWRSSRRIQEKFIPSKKAQIKPASGT